MKMIQFVLHIYKMLRIYHVIYTKYLFYVWLTSLYKCDFGSNSDGIGEYPNSAKRYFSVIFVCQIFCSYIFMNSSITHWKITSNNAQNWPIKNHGIFYFLGIYFKKTQISGIQFNPSLSLYRYTQGLFEVGGPQLIFCIFLDAFLNINPQLLMLYTLIFLNNHLNRLKRN